MKLKSGISKTNKSLEIFSNIKKSNNATDEKIQYMNTSFTKSTDTINKITDSIVSISHKSSDNIDLIKVLQKKESMKIDYFTDTLSFLEQLDCLLNIQNR